MTDGTIIRDMLDELAAIARRRDRAQQNGAVAARVGGARDGASQYAGVDGMMDCVVRSFWRLAGGRGHFKFCPPAA